MAAFNPFAGLPTTDLTGCSRNGEFQGILLPIHPVYADRILDGSKRFEFRRVAPKRVVSHLVMYVTAPRRRIVAIAEVGAIHRGEPGALWPKVAAGAGLDRATYDAYVADRGTLTAFEVTDVAVLSSPVDPRDLFTDWTPPQGFRYVGPEFLAQLQKLAGAAN